MCLKGSTTPHIFSTQRTNQERDEWLWCGITLASLTCLLHITGLTTHDQISQVFLPQCAYWKPPKRMLETEWRLRNETSSYTCFPSLGCLVTLHCLEAIPTGIPSLPPQCAYLCKQSTFCQLWCRRAHDKQLKKQALSKHQLYCTPRDPTARLLESVSFPSNTWHYSLLPTAKVIPFPTLEHTRVPICSTMPVLAEIRCQWCWPNNMKINNISTIYSFLLR